MQCDICFRPSAPSLPFLCAVDARNRLYEPRITQVKTLISNAELDREVGVVLARGRGGDGEMGRGKEGITRVSEEDTGKGNGTATGEVTEGRDGSRNIELQGLLAQRDSVRRRTEEILARADQLRRDVQEARAALAERRVVMQKRREELDKVSAGLQAKRDRRVDEAQKAIKMVRYKWNQTHAITASSRAFLCAEAAKLYGLRKVRRSNGKEEFHIGGMGIMDLTALNSTYHPRRCRHSGLIVIAASPAQVSTSLSHVVHLLVLCSHYLAIQLPAEVTLPHRDYPQPTIFSLPSSYSHTNIPFPGTTPIQSSHSSPIDPRHEHSSQPRPRPLYIAKPLPLLANEDPASYAFFLEGVTLLAYDIAWLCRSQGVPVGQTSSFEDICAIGKNLYSLLVAAQAPMPPRRAASSETTTTTTTQDTSAAKPQVAMGHFSHGTTHTSLSSAEGTEYIRSWKLLSPLKLADRLKSLLTNEVANAEWEVLDHDAWDADDRGEHDTVVLGSRRDSRAQGHGRVVPGMQSFMSIKSVVDMVTARTTDEAPGVSGGTSGWTKLKPRTGQ